MRDFTLSQYRRYLSAIQNAGIYFVRYVDFMKQPESFSTFCLIRHDVDRKPMNAIRMAQLEHQMGIVATYYFRTKKHTLKKEIIQKIEALGHEIGYHYENLSDTDGDIKKAMEDFKYNLSNLRDIATIQTCAMHGRPLKPYDNRDLWKDKVNHQVLMDELDIIGEVYLDIDYTDIAYINDTGRNWTSGKSNVRDKVISNVKADFENKEQLISFLENKKHDKLVFQIHPERWSNDLIDWTTQYLKDVLINFAKMILK